MGVVAVIIAMVCKANIRTVVTQSTMTSGLVGLIALFGIAWLADTWIGANETAIINVMGDLVGQWRWFIAIAIFIVAALTTSQAAALAAIVPIGLTSAYHLSTLRHLRLPASASTSSRRTDPRSPASRRMRPARPGSASTPLALLSLPMFVMWSVAP